MFDYEPELIQTSMGDSPVPVFSPAWEYQNRLRTHGPPPGEFFTAVDLMKMSFPDPKWAVPGLVPEGLTRLVGAPKFGKSWLCLDLAIAIASGGKALNAIDVERGVVIYAALEDTPRRLQGRLEILLGSNEPPSGLVLATAIPRLPDLRHTITDQLESNPGTRMVIIDVLRKVRPRGDGNGQIYNEDYDSTSALKSLADEFQIAILAVHHTRKALDPDDVLNEVSGSTGLTGAADAIIVAKRARNSADAQLFVTGRDVPEAEFGVSWDDTSCNWSLLDLPASAVNMHRGRRELLERVLAHPGESPRDIANALGLNQATVRSTLTRMLQADQLRSDGAGNYYPV